MIFASSIYDMVLCFFKMLICCVKAHHNVFKINEAHGILLYLLLYELE